MCSLAHIHFCLQRSWEWFKEGWRECYQRCEIFHGEACSHCLAVFSSRYSHNNSITHKKVLKTVFEKQNVITFIFSCRWAPSILLAIWWPTWHPIWGMYQTKKTHTRVLILSKKILLFIEAYHLKAPWVTRSNIRGLHHRTICLGYDASKLKWLRSIGSFCF